ncbi:MAG: hypothetical protein WCG30_00950 [Candidatus Saccharibacteria bacterium]
MIRKIAIIVLSFVFFGTLLQGSASALSINSSVMAPNIVAAATDSATCDASGSFGPFGWIACPVINMVTGAEETAESMIMNLLKTKVISFNSTCDSVHKDGCIFKVWSDFRILGNAFLIIALLIAIIVETVGGGAIANYTIKKMIPRVVVAVILINLSIYIMAILEDIFNILGAGLFDLIKAPFGDAWSFNLGGGSATLFSVLIAGGAAAGLVTIVGTLLAGTFAATIGVLLLVIVLPVVLAIIAVLITISFRQGLLVLLVMSSPVAFALYCLPNTEVFFKKWWSLTLKTLAVYPIIVGLFAMSQVMGIIFSSLDSGATGDVTKFLGVAAVAAPIFLVPFAFKLSGGAIAGVAGGVAKLSKVTSNAIKGDPRDPKSRINRAKANALQARHDAGVSATMLGQRRPKLAGWRGAFARGGQGTANVRDMQAAKAGAFAARKLADNEVYNMNKNDDDFIAAGANPADVQARIDALPAGSAERARLERAQAKVRALPSIPGRELAFAEQKASVMRGYNSAGVNSRTGVAYAADDYQAQNEAMARDACVGINDAQVVADPGNPRGWSIQGSGRDTAITKLSSMKAAARTAGYSHLGNAGPNAEDYDPEAGTQILKGPELAGQSRATLAAIGLHAVSAVDPATGAPRYTRDDRLIKLAELQHIIGSGSTSSDAKEGAKIGAAHILASVGPISESDWDTANSAARKPEDHIVIDDSHIDMIEKPKFGPPTP